MASLVTDLAAGRETLRRFRSGRIEMRGGKLVGVRPLWFPSRASVAQVWLQSRWRRGGSDRCVLDYHQPLGSPGFLVLDYVRSGPGTRLATFRGALEVLDEIARLRGSLAIVAHVSTRAISDRLLQRWGWQQHLHHRQGRHWIKRFYDGYPASRLMSYLPAAPTASAENSCPPRFHPNAPAAEQPYML